MQSNFKINPLYWFILVILLTSLACGSSAVVQTQTADQPTTEEQSSQPSQIESPTDIPKPTNTPKPTAIPPTQTPLPIGLSRDNPNSRNETVTTPNWEIQVQEIKRGEEAWIDVQNANMFNEPAPVGMEYLLIKLHVKNISNDSEEHYISGCDFDVTGDGLILYTCSMANVVAPEPQLDATLFTNGETEGWAGYLVKQGEGNLLLLVNELFGLDSNSMRYIAIDDGASISVPSDLADITPNELGIERTQPASKTDQVITEDWEISILESIRGDDAWTMVQEANEFNEPPMDGMEYIVAKIHAKFIGTEDMYENISSGYFTATGSAGVLYDLPLVVPPNPQLDVSLYPGGEFEGWVVVQAAKGETDVKLVFSPYFDFSGENTRYISLE